MIIQMIADTILNFDKYATNIFYKIKLQKELKKIDLQRFNIEELSNQHLKSDIVYNLQNTDASDRNLSHMLSHLIYQQDGRDRQYYDITDFYGSLSGKSSCHRNLYDFAQKNLSESYSGRRKIGFQSDEDWAKNTSDVEELILKKRVTAYLTSWNNRVFLCGVDGAHRLAASYRQALEQQRFYKVKSKPKILSLNSLAVTELMRSYYCFIFCDSDANITKVESLLYINFSRREPHLIEVSSMQKFENSKSYRYCFIRKKTWATDILSSYFFNMTLQNKAINLKPLLKDGSGIRTNKGSL
jgi:hypothetical protein